MKRNNLFLKNTEQGMMVLMLVLIVSAVVLLISAGSFLRSIEELQMTADSENSSLAWAATSGCVEKALFELGTSTDSVGWDYAGDETLTIGSHSCYIGITASGTSKLIQASSTVNLFTKKIQVEVSTNTPSIIVESWEEVADFSL